KDFPNLQKRDGKKVFEVRPKMDWDKGKAVLWLLQVLHLDGPDVLPIYVGDDSTDEDAFRALKGRGLGVLVSDTVRESAADYSLRDTGQTKQFLEMLTTIMQEAR
ncbi:MAG: trehalose-phosphatase, partial [Acidiferrobacterales bacterium]